MKIIVMEHFNGTLFHKSGPANKQHTNQPTNQPTFNVRLYFIDIDYEVKIIFR